MSMAPVTVAELLAAPQNFDALIDVRSPAEFAEDHLPGAVNWPVLDDAERARVGTIYKQVSTFEARKLGAALVARRIAETLERYVAEQGKDWRPLVYCWRGGQRSGSLSLVLAQIGFRTRQLTGGYKAFRSQVRCELEQLPGWLAFHVLQGRTGSGKTRLLGALAAQGAQVLDLEALAAHRGSVLGGMPDLPQPSQKHFETLLWQQLASFDPARPVFVESESRRIGQRQIPDQLLACIQAPAQWIAVEMPLESRIQLLLQDYAEFTQAPETLCERLAQLTELRGRAVVERWQALARAQDWPALLPELLQNHYDPLYDRQATHLHTQALTSLPLHLPDGQTASLQTAARQLLAG